MKFNKKFDRDFNFYLENSEKFNFCGEEIVVSSIDLQNGRSAKECFYFLDSLGKMLPCCEPEIFKKIITCKKSINLHLKMWADGWYDMLEPVEYYLNEFNGHIPKWVKKSLLKQKNKVGFKLHKNLFKQK